MQSNCFQAFKRYIFIMSIFQFQSSVLTFFIALTLSECLIPCPLSWSTFFKGSNFPSNAVGTNIRPLFDLPRNKNVTEYFIARVERYGSFEIGTTDRHLNESFFNLEAGYGSGNSFEILTNPFNCTLKWVSVDSKVLPIKFLASTGSVNDFIGSEKSISNATDIRYPCTLRGNKLRSCRTGQNKGDRKERRSIAVLSSYISPKLQVDLHDIIVRNRSEEQFQTFYLGCDKVRNKGSAEISQLVTHSTDVSKKVTIDLEGGLYLGGDAQVEFELALTVFGVKVLFGSISIHLGIDLRANVGGDYTEEETTQVSTTQRLNLPPKTMVEACSQASIRSLNVAFEAKAKVSHPFLGSIKVMTMLENDDRFYGPFDTHLDGKSIVGRVKGIAKIVQPFSTEFIVSPINYFEAGQLFKNSLHKDADKMPIFH